MLKHRSVLKVKAMAAVTTAALLGLPMHAERDFTLDSALRSATAGITGNRSHADSLAADRAQIDKGLEEIAKKIDISQEESRKRAENAKLAKKRDSALGAVSDINLAKVEILASRERKNTEALASIRQMPTSISADPSVFSTSQYSGVCSVDFSAAEQFVQRGLSPEQAKLKKILGEKVESERKDDVLKLVEAVKKARKHLRHRNDERESVSELRKSTSAASPTGFDLKSRLAGLETERAILKRQAADAKDKKEDVQDKFLDFVEQTLLDDSDFQSTLIAFADALEVQRGQLYQSVVNGAESASRACTEIANGLGRNGLSGPKTNLNTAKKWVDRYYSGPANIKKHKEFTAELTQLSQNVQCVNKTASIKNILGQDLKSKIDALRVVTDPNTARRSVVALLDGFEGAIGQVGQLLHGGNTRGQVAGAGQQGVLSACELVQAKDKRVREIVTSVKEQSDKAREGIPFAGGTDRGSVGNRSFAAPSQLPYVPQQGLVPQRHI